MTSEKTLVLLKPSAVIRGLIGHIVDRIERKGLKIVAMKMIMISTEKAECMYSIHKGKPFFKQLIKYICSAPVVVMVVEAGQAVKIMRKLIGFTDPIEAIPGTIRGDLAFSTTKNIIHTSDSMENSKKEIEIFFTADEFLEYRRSDESWL